MTTRAQLDLALWNLAQERCKAAYDQCPDAFAQALRHQKCRGKACRDIYKQHPKEWYAW